MAESDGDKVTGAEDDPVTGQEGDGGKDSTAGPVLSEEAREWVRKTVAEMGPLSQEDREYLAYMFHRRL